MKLISTSLFIATVLIVTATGAHADFTNPTSAPFAGQPFTDYAKWDTFAIPSGAPNAPDQPGDTNLNTDIEQTLASAFLIAGNIYSFSDPCSFILTDSSPTPLRQVYLQTSTRGSELDYSNVILNYTDAMGMPQSLAWDTYTELSNIPVQGVDVESLFTWDLTGLTEKITEYTITFQAAAPSLSLDAVILETEQLVAIEVYCTALINSAGCTPEITATGLASVSSTQPFDLSASMILENKAGLLFYSTNGPGVIPFQGGTLCMFPPLRRTPVQFSGTNGGTCSGIYNFEFNSLIQSGADSELAAGQTVNTQYWSRDPQAIAGSSLTNAIEFLILD